MTILKSGIRAKQSLLGDQLRRMLRRPVVLLVDADGAAIEDAGSPDSYWAITPLQDEVNP
jgi:hypothetical protein